MVNKSGKTRKMLHRDEAKEMKECNNKKNQEEEQEYYLKLKFWNACQRRARCRCIIVLCFLQAHQEMFPLPKKMYGCLPTLWSEPRMVQRSGSLVCFPGEKKLII